MELDYSQIGKRIARRRKELELNGLCRIGKNKLLMLSYVIAEGLKMGLSDAMLSVN